MMSWAQAMLRMILCALQLINDELAISIGAWASKILVPCSRLPLVSSWLSFPPCILYLGHMQTINVAWTIFLGYNVLTKASVSYVYKQS